MKVQDVMQRNVQLGSPDQTLREAATIMAQCDIGILPVAENDRMVGMITDRDIAVRAVARGLSPDTPLREVMSHEVKYCFEDEDTDHVCHNMAEIQVRRLPVVDRDKKLVGIVSLSDIHQPETIGAAVEGITKPGGQHSQSFEKMH